MCIRDRARTTRPTVSASRRKWRRRTTGPGPCAPPSKQTRACRASSASRKPFNASGPTASIMRSSAYGQARLQLSLIHI
eukprot:3521785-Alexandrium_andersonii.AAC.1